MGRDPADAVRRFDPGDADAVVDLHERALDAAGTDPTDVPGTRDLRRVEAAYLDTGGEFLVGEAGGAVVAMGGPPVDGPLGELFRMTVDPAHQREGYGSAIIEGLEAAARERGVKRTRLTTGARQESALGFYARHGYAETGRESHGEHELVGFAKRLD
ncbi:N-acetyltransferase [Halobacteriales archaeon QS_4_69_31]|nr:MAG: N-acetyltransferase [Halobacteriales archaeon QS_4_69_31]